MNESKQPYSFDLEGFDMCEVHVLKKYDVHFFKLDWGKICSKKYEKEQIQFKTKIMKETS